MVTLLTAATNVCFVLCFYFFFKPLLWIRILNVQFFPPRHERLTSAAPHDQFPHLCLFSCRKTDCVHHKTTASSHLLPLLNWQWGTTTLPMGLNSILYILSSVPLHSFAASLFLLSLFLSVTFLLAADKLMEPHGKLTWLYTPCGHPDMTLWPLCALRVPELQNANHSIGYCGHKLLLQHYIASQQHYDLDNTNALFDKKQRLWLHLSNSCRSERRLRLIKRNCWDQNRTLWWNFTLISITLCFEEIEGMCNFFSLIVKYYRRISYHWEPMFIDLIRYV